MVGQDAELAPVGADLDRTDIGGLARRGMLSLAGAAVSAVASLLIIVVITRGAGKEVAGNLFSATSLFVIAESLCALGTTTGLVYFIARMRALDHGYGVGPILRVALPPVVGVSVVVAALLFGLAPVLARVISDGPDPALTTLLRVLVVFLPCAVLFDVGIAGTQGFHTMTPTVLLEKAGRPTLQILLLLLAHASGTPWLLALAWVAPYAIGFVIIWVLLRRLVRADPGVRGQDQPLIAPSEFWKYTGPRGTAAVAQLALQRLDIILVAAYLGPRDAAIYTAATRFVVLGQLGSQAVALGVQPKYSELLACHDLAGTQRVFRTSTAWVMAVTWPIHVLVGVLAPVVLLLFGSGYDVGRWVVVILAGAMLVATGCGMVTMLLVMAGRTTANLINVVIAFSANLLLNIVLIPRLGILGAAIAWAVAIVLSNLAPLLQVRSALHLHPFGRGSAAVATLALLALGGIPALGWLLGGSVPIVVACAGVGIVLYGSGVWRLRHLLELDDLIAPIMRRLT